MAGDAPELPEDPQLLQAVAFLLSARVATTPVPERVEFLRSKGLGEEQITRALAKAGLAGTDTAPGSGSGWLRRIVGLGIVAASAAAVTSLVRTPAPERAPEALSTPDKSDPDAVTELASLSANVLSRHEERLAALEELQTNFAESLSALRDDLTSVINDVIGNAFASRESETPVRLLGHDALTSPTAAAGSTQASAAATAKDSLGADAPLAPPEFGTSEVTSEVRTTGGVSVANGRKWSGRGDLRGLAKGTPPTPASAGATPSSTPSATPAAPSPPFDTPTPYMTCQPPTPDSTRGPVAYGSPPYGSPYGPSNGSSSGSVPSQPAPTGRDGVAASSCGGESPAAEAFAFTAAEAAQSVSEQVAAAAVGSAVAAAAAAAASASAGPSAAKSSPGETSEAATALSPDAVMRALREGRESSLPHTSRIDDMPIGFSPVGASTAPPPTDLPPPPHASTPLSARSSTSESPPPPPSGTPPPPVSPSPAVPFLPLPKPWERASLAAPIASSLGVVSADGMGAAAAAPHAPGTELGDEKPELEAAVPELDDHSGRTIPTPDPDAHSGHPFPTPTSPAAQTGHLSPPPLPKLDALAEAAATATAPLRHSEPSTAPPLASESSTEAVETASGSSAETSFANGGESADVGPSAGAAESSGAVLNATARSAGPVTAPSNAKAGGGNSRRKNKGKRL